MGRFVDEGTNGGLARDDIHILEIDLITKVYVMGIGEEVFEAMPVVQCAGLVETTDEGKIILIMSQYALYKSGKTIH